MEPKSAPPGLGDLLAQVGGHLSRWMAAEFALTRLELRAAGTAALWAVALGFGALIIGMIVMVLLALAVVQGLIALGVMPWLAHLTTAVVFFLVMLGLIWWAGRLISRAVGMPRRRIAEISRDVRDVVEALRTGETE